jgi:pentapeptide MXKDX repeat protein
MGCSANVTFPRQAHPIWYAVQGAPIQLLKGKSMKLIGKLMTLCVLTASLSAFAQSSGGDMKQDEMKHDDMKQDTMKKDDTKKDKKMTKKTKKDSMKKDDMKKDDMKHDDMSKDDGKKN